MYFLPLFSRTIQPNSNWLGLKAFAAQRKPVKLRFKYSLGNIHQCREPVLSWFGWQKYFAFQVLARRQKVLSWVWNTNFEWMRVPSASIAIGNGSTTFEQHPWTRDIMIPDHWTSIQIPTRPDLERIGPSEREAKDTFWRRMTQILKLEDLEDHNYSRHRSIKRNPYYQASSSEVLRLYKNDKQTFKRAFEFWSLKRCLKELYTIELTPLLLEFRNHSELRHFSLQNSACSTGVVDKVTMGTTLYVLRTFRCCTARTSLYNKDFMQVRELACLPALYDDLENSGMKQPWWWQKLGSLQASVWNAPRSLLSFLITVCIFIIMFIPS